MLGAAGFNQGTVRRPFAVLRVGHNAGARIDVHCRDSLIGKDFGHQAAGDTLTKTHYQVIGPGSQFTDCGQAAKNLVQGLEFLLDPALQRAPALLREQERRSVAVAVAKPRAYGQGPVSIPTAGGFTCGQELVGDFGQGTDHHHHPMPTRLSGPRQSWRRRLIAGASSTDVPPNFMTTGFMRKQPPDRQPEPACPGQPGTPHSIPPHPLPRELCCGRGR